MEPIFKKSWLEAIAYLPESVRNRIVLIVMLFQLNGSLPEKMSSTVRCAVRFILAELGVDFSTLTGTSLFPSQKNDTPNNPKEEPKVPQDAAEVSEQHKVTYDFTKVEYKDRDYILKGIAAYCRFVLSGVTPVYAWPIQLGEFQRMARIVEDMRNRTSFPCDYIRNYVDGILKILSNCFE